MEGNQYKTLLHHLSLLPEEYLVQVNIYIKSLADKVEQKSKNRKEILSLAGSWSDMNDSDFSEYLKTAKESGQSLFDREVEL
jgi:hypothetical protein